jgi:hypothetical protein
MRATGRAMPSKFRRDLNSLELEILEKFFENTLVTVKEDNALIDLVSDEELEAALRRELIDIATANNVSDAETLRDVLLAAISDQRD